MSQLLGVECPSCKTTFEIEGDEMIGQTIECPECQTKITIPPDAPRLKRTLKLKDLEPEETVKQCPKCLAMLDGEAVQCMDCGQTFSSGEEVSPDSDPAGARGFLGRFKWALVGGAVAAILIGYWMVSSVRSKRIDRAYGYAIASATSSKSLDQAIGILQAVSQQYPDHPASQQTRKLLLDKRSERDAMVAVTEAVKTARGQREARQYDAAVSNLQETVNAYSHAPNIQEAKTLLDRLQKQQREYQTEQVTAAMASVRGMSRPEAAALLLGIAETHPWAANLPEAANLLAKVQAEAKEEQALAEVHKQFPPGSFLLQLQSKGTVYGPYVFSNACVVKLGSAALTITNVQGTTFSLKHRNVGRMYGPFEFTDGGTLLLDKTSYTIVTSNLAALMPSRTSTNGPPPGVEVDKSGKSNPSTNAVERNPSQPEKQLQPSAGSAAASPCATCKGTGKIPCPDPGCVAVREANRDAGEDVNVLRRKTGPDGTPGLRRLTPCKQCGRTGQVTCPKCNGSGHD